jgi:hypothetical protein
LILLIGLFAPTRCSNASECAQLKKPAGALVSLALVTGRGLLSSFVFAFCFPLSFSSLFFFAFSRPVIRPTPLAGDR